MTDRLAQLYPAHLAALRQRADAALERGGCEHLVIPSGVQHLRYLDDLAYPYRSNPHFLAWLPLDKVQGCWLVYTPGARLRLIYLEPRDYWHVVPEPPAGYWVDHFDIDVIHSAADARALLPKDPRRCAVIGEASAGLADFPCVAPAAVVDQLHYQRAFKTEYEIEMMREANRIGVAGHRAAELAFRSGESEFGIHMAYLHATRQMESELPYDNIIALNEHAAVLHYMQLERTPPAAATSFLIDAGGNFHGYASDITRTWAAHDADEFQALIDAMDEAQQGFCARVRPGQSYPELHLHAHQVIAGILKQHGFIDMSAEEAVASGVSGAFFPHGLGHMIGLQVHDIGGFMADAEGGTLPRPEGHPHLRLTRTLAPDMVVTIEPGLYFIDLLLDQLRPTPQGKRINWDKVAAFRRYGGIRIEDDVVCTDDAPFNLTRDAFAD